jgi:hypothetical protein
MNSNGGKVQSKGSEVLQSFEDGIRASKIFVG